MTVPLELNGDGTIDGLLDGEWTSSLAGKVASVDLPYHSELSSLTKPIATTGITNSAITGYYGSSGYTSGAQNDYVEWEFGPVAAGTYTLRTAYIKNPAHGIAAISIDGGAALGTTIDLYNATNSPNNVTDIAGIALTAGRHKVRYTATSKNASAAAYYLNLQGFTLTRTGA